MILRYVLNLKLKNKLNLKKKKKFILNIFYFKLVAF